MPVKCSPPTSASQWLTSSSSIGPIGCLPTSAVISAARRRLHPHPRRQVRRPRRHRIAGDEGRLHRRDGSRRTHDDRTKRLVDAGVDQAGLIASDRRSVSISGPAPPRRRRSPSWRRSSQSAPAALLPPSPAPRVRSTIEQLGEGGGPIGSLWCLTNVEALTPVEVGAVVDRQLPCVGAPGVTGATGR